MKNEEITVEELYNVLSELQDTDRIVINRNNNLDVKSFDGDIKGYIDLRSSYARYQETKEESY